MIRMCFFAYLTAALQQLGKKLAAQPKACSARRSCHRTKGNNNPTCFFAYLTTTLRKLDVEAGQAAQGLPGGALVPIKL
jgi:hypothetical protein